MNLYCNIEMSYQKLIPNFAYEITMAYLATQSNDYYTV